MMDEVNLERKELSRLLSTAQNEERRDMIKRAMQALDGHEKAVTSTPEKMNPNIQASLFQGSAMPVLESVNPKLMRPASARRRPSMPNLLDSIPEILSGNRNNSDKDSDIMLLPYEDIAEVIPSSSDSRFPVKNIFKTNISSSSNTNSLNPNSSSSSSLHHGQGLIHQNSQSQGLGFRSGSRSYWMSTGLTPQFICISFYEKWAMRKVEVKTLEVTKIALHVNYTASTIFSSSKLIELRKDGDGRFSLELEAKNGDGSGVSGIGLVLMILESSSCFCGISQVKIFVSPNS